MRSLLATGLLAVAAVLATVVAAQPASATTPATQGANPATPAVRGLNPVTPALGGLSAATPAAGAASSFYVPDYTQLSDASCFHAADCLSVGVRSTKTSLASPVAAKWNGSSWDSTGVPLPPGGSRGELNSVSCKTGGCVAVGDYVSGIHAYPLAEYFNGNKWTVGRQPVAVAGVVTVTLDSISCQSASYCVAVGSYTPITPVNRVYALAEVWSGGTWRISRAPSQAPRSGLDAISCPASNYCVADGSYQNSAGDYAWAEKFAGAHWTMLKVAQPTTASAHYQYISGVSCTGNGLAGVRNGTTWKWDVL